MDNTIDNFRLFFETNSLPIAIVNFDLNFVEINQSVTKLLGYKNDELVNQSIFSITEYEENEDFSFHPSIFLKKGIDNFQLKRKYRGKDGTIHSGTLFISTFQDNHTDSQYIAAFFYTHNLDIVSDIDALNNKGLLGTMFSISPDIYFIMDVKNKQNIYQNHCLFQYLGYDNDDAKKEDELKFVYSKIDKDSIRDINTDTSISIGKHPKQEEQEYRIRTKSGEWKWFYTRTIPIKYDKNGDTLLSYGFTQDISSRIFSNKSNEEQQRFIEKIADSIPDYIIVYNIKTLAPIYTNFKTRLFLGYNEDEWRKLGIKAIHPDYRERTLQIFEDIKKMSDTQILHTIEQYQNKAGHWSWLDSKRSIFSRDDEGNVELVVTIVSDITGKKEAEKQLIEHQNFIDNIVQTIPSTLYVYDINTLKTIYTNFLGVNFLGYTNREWKTEGMGALHPQHYEESLKNIETFKTLKDDDIFKSEMLYKNKQGEWVWVEFWSKVFKRDEDGNVSQMLSVAVDIHEQKTVYTELEKSEKTQRAILGALPDLIMKISKEGEYLEIYPAKRETEYRPQTTNLIGKNIKDLLPPDTYSITNANIQKAFNENRIISFEMERILDGKSFILNSSISPIDDKSAIIVVENITERVKAKENLMTSERTQRAILEATPDTILILDKNGDYLKVYPAKGETQYIPPANIEGKNLRDLIPIEMYNVVFPKIQEALEKQEIIRIDIDHDYQGNLFHLTSHVSPIDDKIVAVVIRNITHRIKTQKSLDEKLKELSEKNKQLEQYVEKNIELERFAYIVSHDLKEPLRSIKSFSEILKSKYDTEDTEIAPIIDFISAGVERMNSLIEGILNFSKIEEISTSFEMTNTNNLIDTISHDLINIITEKNAKINVINPLPNIYCDKIQIRQVFQNLINNAIKFSKKQPIIDIECVETSKHWQFSIKDNGIGIDMKNAKDIFNMFRRLNKRSEYAGQGLGLSICRKIIERHEGQIWLESELGKGTTFFFTIPK